MCDQDVLHYDYELLSTASITASKSNFDSIASLQLFLVFYAFWAEMIITLRHWSWAVIIISHVDSAVNF